RFLSAVSLINLALTRTVRSGLCTCANSAAVALVGFGERKEAAHFQHIFAQKPRPISERGFFD
ncbi:MAG: hypothetical protein ACI4JT_10960, partial [Oscillospiraceae bacterium]